MRGASGRDLPDGGGRIFAGAGDRAGGVVAGEEGRRLLRFDAQLEHDLGITSGPSPALMWENRYGPFRWHEIEWKALLRGENHAK